MTCARNISYAEIWKCGILSGTFINSYFLHMRESSWTLKIQKLVKMSCVGIRCFNHTWFYHTCTEHLMVVTVKMRKHTCMLFRFAIWTYCLLVLVFLFLIRRTCVTFAIFWNICWLFWLSADCWLNFLTLTLLAFSSQQ